MNKETLPNWSVFSAHSVGITLIKLTDPEDDRTVYQVMYDFSLDDGSEEEPLPDVPTNHISILTDIQTEDKMEAIDLAMKGLLSAFAVILDEVIVVDETDNLLEKISMNDEYNEYMEFPESEDIPPSGKHLLH